MKKVLSMFLAFLMVLSLCPTQVYAVSVTKLEVIQNNAPIRRKANSEGEIATRCSVGSILESSGSLVNSRGNKWYKVNYNGSTCFIFSGNVKIHSHNYQSMTLDGITYKACDCGDVQVSYTVYEKEKVLKANALAGVATGFVLSQCGSTVVAPGVGNAIVAVLTIYAAYQVMSGSMTTEIATAIVKELTWSDYLWERRNVCSDTSFRMVKRDGWKLTYINDRCLSLPEAYVYVRYLCGDVYTEYASTALALASINKDGYVGPERDSDKPDYYYHFHMLAESQLEQVDKLSAEIIINSMDGTCKRVKRTKGHIFYGATDSGLRPS